MPGPVALELQHLRVVPQNGRAVGNAHQRHAGGPQAFIQRCLVGAVQRAGRLVQDQQGRAAKNGARNGDPLALPAGEPASPLGQDGFDYAFQADYAKLKASWGGYTGYDRWFAQPLSNAHLGAVASYLEWVPAFTALYHRDGGDWARFYADVKTMARESKQQREVALRVLAPAAMAKSEGITQK